MKNGTIARCVEVYSKKPQLQERLTTEIADSIMEYLDAQGVMVVVEGEHMCMTMRGVRKPGAKTVTTTYRGRKIKKRESLQSENQIKEKPIQKNIIKKKKKKIFLCNQKKYSLIQE